MRNWDSLESAVYPGWHSDSRIWTQACPGMHNAKIYSFFFLSFLLLFFNVSAFYLFFILLYNIVLVLPYINMHLPWVYTCSPSRSPLTSLPIPSLWVIPVHQPRASCILHQIWTGNAFLIWYYTCFNAILPNHPPPQSPKDCSIRLCLFCHLANRVVVTIFLNSIYMHSYTVLVFFLSGLLHSV